MELTNEHMARDDRFEIHDAERKRCLEEDLARVDWKRAEEEAADLHDRLTGIEIVARRWSLAARRQSGTARELVLLLLLLRLLLLLMLLLLLLLCCYWELDLELEREARWL
jgi:hypothetical protein